MCIFGLQDSMHEIAKVLVASNHQWGYLMYISTYVKNQWINKYTSLLQNSYSLYNLSCAQK